MSLQDALRARKKTLIREPQKGLLDVPKRLAAKYLQLKTNHAFIGTYLYRFKLVDTPSCWWCNREQQCVAHLLFQCRKWRPQREKLLKDLPSTLINSRDITRFSSKTAVTKEVFLDPDAIKPLLEFLGTTAVGKRVQELELERGDAWDIELLDSGNIT